MASTSSPHVRKRQYQPSIRSYFDRNADPSRAHSTTSPMSPPLPAETQASLLSVGMRVRKSVPEGYKTHKTLGTDGFPFPSTAPSAAREPRPRPSYNTESPRELTPFCGLHKTGGWAAQPQAYAPPPSSAPSVMQHDSLDEDDDPPGLSMSQATIPSTQSSFMSALSVDMGANRKRTFEEEMENDMDAFFDEADATEEAVAPRKIAKPRGGLRRAATDGVATMAAAAAAAATGDFEEAAFLAPMDVDD